jgi:hypothetical protein
MAPSIDDHLAATAGSQGGYVTRAQLLKLGLTNAQIVYRTRIGRLIRVYNGVYAVGHVPTAPLDQAHGALLACDRKAVIGIWSAAHLWTMWVRWPTIIEVITGDDRRPGGLNVRRAQLTHADIRKRNGVWVTSPARTTLDIARSCRPRRSSGS